MALYAIVAVLAYAVFVCFAAVFAGADFAKARRAHDSRATVELGAFILGVPLILDALLVLLISWVTAYLAM